MFCHEYFRSRKERVRAHVSALLLLPPLLLLPTLLLLGGCASQGQPQPPSLQLPALAEKLTAQRAGDRVTLAWTTSANSTDGDKIKGAIAAVVCLDAAPVSTAAPAPPSRKNAKKGQRNATSGTPGPPPFACNAVGRVEVTPGPSRAEVAMAAELASGASKLLAYRIELENRKGRSAGPSPQVFVAGGAAPGAVSPLKIAARREAALIEWQAAASTGATMELKRTLIATAEGPVEATARSTAGPKPAKAPAAFAPGAPKAPAREVVLRAAGAGDPGGMVDATVRDGETYTYVAQRVQTVTIGSNTLEVRSAPSPVATFTYRDVFPPKPPTRLVLIPGGGFGEAPSIDLSWDANLEVDVLGYNVYRSQSGGAFVRMNAEPLAAPEFRDLRVEPGRQYTYRVTAVDQRHNESAPGTEVKETLR